MPASSGGEPLRRRLLLLAAAAILPLAVMAALALVALVGQQRAQAERAALEIARALSTAVDGELRRSVAVVEALSISPALDAADIRRYYEVMRRVAAQRSDFLTMTLSDPSGKQLANTSFAFAAPLPQVADSRSFERVVREGRPAVGDMAPGPSGRLAFPVRVPVIRDGELRYVLTAALKPDVMFDVLRRQRVPSDWVVSVFDASGQRVARSRQQQASVGQRASPSLQALMDEGSLEGTGPTRTVEGDEVYTAFSRSAESGWTVAVGIPSALVGVAATRSALAYGGGLLLSIVLGAFAAILVARRITRPIAGLSGAAAALGRREEVKIPDTPILELRGVGAALAAAAAERASHESEREELLIREQQARGAAEAANRAKDEFLAMLGHELRNPLGAIANASRLLEHPRLDAAGAERARAVIQRQTEHLARLTDDLLDAGRAVIGKILLDREPLELSALVARALDTLRAGGRLAEHRVERQLAPVWVQGDATRLEQIVMNLVGNAVKYTPAQGTITIGVANEGSEAVLTVRDSGVGMPPELVERAFDLFVQGEHALDRAQGGLGIGLTLVRRLAELHGGSATAASAGRGRGSVLTVRLPAIPSPAAPAPSPRAVRCPESRDILVVEDNEDAAETLRHLLAIAGHRVRVARDGVAGLQAALAEPPEVALIDIGLPRMDGYELARRLRGAKPRPRLVALTGYGLPEDRARAIEAGFDEHLVKPVNAAALAALLMIKDRPSA